MAATCFDVLGICEERLRKNTKISSRKVGNLAKILPRYLQNKSFERYNYINLFIYTGKVVPVRN